MVRPAGQETLAIKKVVCYTYRSQRRGADPTGVTRGGHRLGQEAEGVRKKHGQEPPL